jgi:hypothetical protein
MLIYKQDQQKAKERRKKNTVFLVNIQKTGVTITKTRSLFNDMKTKEKSTSKISDKMMLDKGQKKITQKKVSFLFLNGISASYRYMR